MFSRNLVCISALFVSNLSLSETLLGEKDIGVVLTPTLLKQSIKDSPASITIITKYQIEKLSIKSIAEAMRLVPGVQVGHRRGNDYRVSLHGGHALVRRWDLLIDGRSEFKPATSEIPWDSLPISIDDVERIEVSRTTSTSAYGTNAFLGVVNVITKLPINSHRSSVRVTAGSLSTVNTWGQVGRVGEISSHRITASSEKNNGFDKDNRYSSDSTRVQRVNYTGVLNPKDDIEINLYGGYTSSEPNFPGDERRIYTDVAQDSYYGQFNIKFSFSNNHSLEIDTYLKDNKEEQPSNVCTPAITLLEEARLLYAINPIYAQVLQGLVSPPNNPSAREVELFLQAQARIGAVGQTAAFSTVCGFVPQKAEERQAQISIKDTLVLSQNFRIVNGIGFRKDDLESEVFLNGVVEEEMYSIFSNMEYEYTPTIVANFGVLYEDKSNDNIASFKISFSKHFFDNQVLRLILAKSYRTPDAFSQNADWSYRVTNIENQVFTGNEGVYYLTTKNENDLKPEELIVQELGYRVELPRKNVVVDLRFFKERLYSLISERLTLEEFNPTNDGYIGMRGFEVEATAKPTQNMLFRLAYGYLDSDTDEAFETVLDYQHQGSVYFMYDPADDWGLSLGYYGTDSSIGPHYDRYDFVLRKRFKSSFSAKATVSYFSNIVNNLILRTNSIVSGNTKKNEYDGSVHAYVSFLFEF